MRVGHVAAQGLSHLGGDGLDVERDHLVAVGEMLRNGGRAYA